METRLYRADTKEIFCVCSSIKVAFCVREFYRIHEHVELVLGFED